MGDLLQTGSAILATSTQAVDVAAQNISNLSTPGYKRILPYPDRSFDRLILDKIKPEISIRDFSSGKITQTGNPYDFSITGSGFFTVRNGDEILYSRNGQFSRTIDDRLITTQGYILQSADGGDLILQGSDPVVDSSGIVVQDGIPKSRIALVDFDDYTALSPAAGGAFSGPATSNPAASPGLRQGAVETSNVSTGDEMVAIMAALRRAEAGQRVIQTYDSLMGQALTAFGQSR